MNEKLKVESRAHVFRVYFRIVAGAQRSGKHKAEQGKLGFIYSCENFSSKHSQIDTLILITWSKAVASAASKH